MIKTGERTGLLGAVEEEDEEYEYESSDDDEQQQCKSSVEEEDLSTEEEGDKEVDEIATGREADIHWISQFVQCLVCGFLF